MQRELRRLQTTAYKDLLSTDVADFVGLSSAPGKDLGGALGPGAVEEIVRKILPVCAPSRTILPSAGADVMGSQSVPCTGKECGETCVVEGDMAGMCDLDGKCSFEYEAVIAACKEKEAADEALDEAIERALPPAESSCPTKEDLWSTVQLYHGMGETVPVTADVWADATWSLVSAKGVDVDESTYKEAAKIQFSSPAFEKDGDAFTDAGGLAASDALLKTVLCKDVAPAAERSLPGGDGMTEEQKAAVEEKLEMAKYFGENPDSPLKAMVEQAIEDGVALADAFGAALPAYEAMLAGAPEEEVQEALDEALAEQAAEKEAADEAPLLGPLGSPSEEVAELQSEVNALKAKLDTVQAALAAGGSCNCSGLFSFNAEELARYGLAELQSICATGNDACGSACAALSNATFKSVKSAINEGRFVEVLAETSNGDLTMTFDTDLYDGSSSYLKMTDAKLSQDVVFEPVLLEPVLLVGEAARRPLAADTRRLTPTLIGLPSIALLLLALTRIRARRADRAGRLAEATERGSEKRVVGSELI